MKKYNDLECSILCCILIEPELINKTILEDKYFINYQAIWKFMKAFYKKFKTFDITLMCSVCKDKYKLMQYIMDILKSEPTSNNFELYEQQLIYLYNEEEKDKWLIKKIYETTCDLWVRSITPQDFKQRINNLYNEADKIFKNKY